MNFVKRLKAFKQSKEAPPAKTIKFERQCPHCTNRGMFVFNDTSKISKIIKTNVSLSHPERVEGPRLTTI